jgi:5-methyltetrahydropteroyltriglutamate--homocysteine methyltransferase
MTPVVNRADVVGSMLRPPSLKRARQQLEAGEITANAFKRIEDRAVDQTIAVQEGAGMDVVTDGELRRLFYFDAVYGDFEGMAPTEEPERIVPFHGGEESIEFVIPVAIKERLKRRRFAAVEEYAYARSKARVPVKVTVPNPLAFALMWHSKESLGGYKDVKELCEHGAELIREEILELAAQGCEYVQVDLPELTMMVDDESRANHWERLGLSNEWLINEGMDLVNACVAGIPDVYFGLHFCRGNHSSQWISQGPYDAMAATFSRVPDYDALLLEYESERAGGFEPLREVPDDKVVVLGLVSSKEDSLEDAEAIVRRIDEAAQFFPRDQLALSTQCGFASVLEGNNLSEDMQEAKLQLISDVARSAWATA